MKIHINPLVTIVTPSFNQGQFIEETILGILNQTYKNIQYIVVDGGSTDNTMEVVNQYRDRIDIIIHEKDKGQTDAINKGFKLAKGELVGWINSDDILYPDCVEKIVELYMKKPDGVIIYNKYQNIIDRISKIKHLITVNIANKEHLLKIDYRIIQQGSFYNTDTIKKINYLNEKLHYCMDLDLWLRLLDYGKIYGIEDIPYSAFREWEDTKTSTGGYKFFREIRKVLFQHGANLFSPNVIRTYWYELKDYIKYILKLK
jgi:glycosyltransferase involved in cell wall biosynthesis